MRSQEDVRRIQAGNDAEAFQKSDCYEAVLSGMHTRYLREITASKPDEQQAREQAYFMIRAIEQFRADVRTLVSARDTVLALEKLPRAKY